MPTTRKKEAAARKGGSGGTSATSTATDTKKAPAKGATAGKAKGMTFEAATGALKAAGSEQTRKTYQRLLGARTGQK